MSDTITWTGCVTHDDQQLSDYGSMCEGDGDRCDWQTITFLREFHYDAVGDKPGYRWVSDE